MRHTLNMFMAVGSLWLLALPIWASEAGQKAPILDLGDYELQVPDGFLVGQYEESDADELFPESAALIQKVAALIEPEFLGDAALEKLPKEDAVTIEVTVWTDRMTELLESYLTDAHKVKLGEQEAYNLRGFPGPYGDLAFFYVVPLAEKRLLTFTALRAHVEGELEGQATGYDQVIESMLRGMRRKGSE